MEQQHALQDQRCHARGRVAGAGQRDSGTAGQGQSCIQQVPSHSSRGRSLSSTCRWHPSLIMRHSLEYILRSEAHTGLWGTLEQSSLHEQRGRPSLSTVHVDPYSHVIPEHTSPSPPCCTTGGSGTWGPTTTTGEGEESWALTRLGSSSVLTLTPQGRVLVGYTQKDRYTRTFIQHAHVY